MANEQVSIVDACRLIGMDVPDGVMHGRNMKLHCPFGEVFHSDGGVEAAMRIYPESNHLYCFAGCGYHTPVTLVAQAFDLTRRDAARELLERAGLREPTREEIWTAVATHHDPPDTAYLAQALKTYCRRTVPDWERRQYEPDVSRRLSACLALLDHVDTDEAALRWLTGCKAIMGRLSPEQMT